MSLTFYLDYRSPYSYLANTQLAQMGGQVSYRPIDVISVMRAVNNQPSTACPPKTRYPVIDAKRWAKLYDVRFAPNRSLLSGLGAGSIDPTLLSRAAIAAVDFGLFGQVNDALFKAVWASEADLLTADGRVAYLRSADIDADGIWELADSRQVADRLAAANKEAIDLGIFGVPTFLVGSEMFFGNDRLRFVEAALKQEQAA
jgi:2-hydroxychromene-2-carboxylate isomerase